MWALACRPLRMLTATCRCISHTPRVAVDSGVIEAGIAELSAQTNRTGRPSMQVTQFITQYDETRQIVEAAGVVERVRTWAMNAGSKVHSTLELEVLSHLLPDFTPLVQDNGSTNLQHSSGEVVPVGVLSKSEARFVDFMNKVSALSRALSTREVGFVVREVMVYGSSNTEPDWELRGIIDAIEVTQTGVRIVEVKTTQRVVLQHAQVLLAAHQAMTYRNLFQSALLLFKEPERMEVAGPRAFFKLCELFDVRNEAVRRVYESAEQSIANNFRTLAAALSPELILQFRLRGGDTIEVVVQHDSEIIGLALQSRADLLAGRRQPHEGSLNTYFPGPWSA